MKKSLLLIIFAIVLASGIKSHIASAEFSDVPQSHPYYEGISYLELIGSVNPGENFRPDDAVSRAELFKIIFKTLHEDPSEAKKGSFFDDISEDAWFTPYANLALTYELIEAGNFDPEKNISKVKALSILMKTYGLSSPIIPMLERSPLFSDVKVSHPFYSILFQAKRIELVTSDANSRYFPFQNLTRGELADMIFRIESWNTETLADEAEEDFYKSDIFADIWNYIINDFYLESGYEINEEVLFQTAVNAILESLNDPYSVYFSADEASEFTDAVDGKFEGIGVVLVQDEETLEVFVADVLSGGPAEAIGLKSGDQIRAIDDINTEGMSLEEVMSRIKGEAETEVKLSIFRNEKSYTYKIVRAQIELDLVKGKIYAQDAWFIDIDSFASTIYEDMMATLAELEAKEPEPSAIILDLRGNPGGYINMGNFVAGLFVKQATPLVILDYGAHQESIVNGDIGPYKNIPLYILVDSFSASASEIVSQTLKETAAATIIGTQTFGKGSAQRIITYWDGSILKITIAHWLSSQGNSIDGIGVTPDILITETDGEEDEWLKALDNALE